MSFAYDAVFMFMCMCVPVCPCETATEPTVQNVCIHVEVKSVQNKWVICSGTTTTDYVYYLVQHQWHGSSSSSSRSTTAQPKPGARLVSSNHASGSTVSWRAAGEEQEANATIELTAPCHFHTRHRNDWRWCTTVVHTYVMSSSVASNGKQPPFTFKCGQLHALSSSYLAQDRGKEL